MFEQITKFVKSMLIALIRIYQIGIAPLLGRHCRFEPSCSEYTRVSIDRFGIFRGVFLGIKRIGRCHPFSNSCGLDPVPEAS